MILTLTRSFHAGFLCLLLLLPRWRCRRTRSLTWWHTTGAPSATLTLSSRWGEDTRTGCDVRGYIAIVVWSVRDVFFPARYILYSHTWWEWKCLDPSACSPVLWTDYLEFEGGLSTNRGCSCGKAEVEQKKNSCHDSQEKKTSVVYFGIFKKKTRR